MTEAQQSLMGVAEELEALRSTVTDLAASGRMNLDRFADPDFAAEFVGLLGEFAGAFDGWAFDWQIRLRREAERV